jgi:hypothetical protein
MMPMPIHLIVTIYKGIKSITLSNCLLLESTKKACNLVKIAISNPKKETEASAVFIISRKSKSESDNWYDRASEVVIRAIPMFESNTASIRDGIDLPLDILSKSSEVIPAALRAVTIGNAKSKV